MVNDRLKSYILGVVENQVANNDPECTKQTLNRLMKSDYSRQPSIEMIGSGADFLYWQYITNLLKINKKNRLIPF